MRAPLIAAGGPEAKSAYLSRDLIGHDLKTGRDVGDRPLKELLGAGNRHRDKAEIAVLGQRRNGLRPDGVRRCSQLVQ